MEEPHTASPTPEEHEESVEQSRLEYLQAVNPRKKKRWWLRSLIALVVLALLAGGTWFVFLRQTDTDKTTPLKATPRTEGPQTVEVTTEHYDSPNLYLGFDYPEKWTVKEEGSLITAISPTYQQTDASGQKQTMRTVMTIAPKGQNLAAFDKGSGLAVLASEKIKYTNPTSVQRAETYLTFAQYNSTPAGDGLDALYITGDNGYQKGQYMPKTDMLQLDPVIAVTFQSCPTTDCSKPVPTTVPASLWGEQTFSKPLLVMLTSISVN